MAYPSKDYKNVDKEVNEIDKIALRRKPLIRAKGDIFEIKCKVCNSKNMVYLEYSDLDYAVLACENCHSQEEFVFEEIIEKKS